MRALLDTNIVIYREDRRVSNESIGNLFYWLDKLEYKKIVSQLTIQEIEKHQVEEVKKVFAVKLQSYEVMKTVASPTSEFLEIVKDYPKKSNDGIDDILLFDVYSGRVDILITEDRKMIEKSIKLKISDRVFSINRFISLATSLKPENVRYKILSVKSSFFGNLNINDVFFDSFRQFYLGFDRWFAKKCDSPVYVCQNENRILGILYIKVEDENCDYSDIEPRFTKAKRLKVGTFKVESTGFRLGERFLKIIFDNGIEQNVSEIYVTLFKDRPELEALIDLLIRWGFQEHGTKTSESGIETVFIKKMKTYDEKQSAKENFPNIKHDVRKFILPILPQYHTDLFPDSILRTENEIDFIENKAYRFALQKNYICWADTSQVHSGDIVLIYRMKSANIPAIYSSVITSITIIDKVENNFDSISQLLETCQNRTVFTVEQLTHFWNTSGKKISLVKLLFVKSLNQKVNLGKIYEIGLFDFPNGPRPFTEITDVAFNKILMHGETKI